MTNTIARLTTSGTYYTSAKFDEVTGIPIIDSSLQILFDAGNLRSYPGSGTIWYDISGNGYIATLTNTPLYSSANGGYISFNGVNQYANTNYIQPAYQSTSSFTWNVWISSGNTSTQGQNATIGNRSYSGSYFDFTKIDNNLTFEYYHTGTVSNYIVPGSVSSNTWYNLAIVKNTSSFSYYVNGVLKNTLVSTNTTGTAPQAFWIGGDLNAGEYGNANISLVSIYNRPLSSTEVVTNYNALAPRFNLSQITVGTGAPSSVTTTAVYLNYMDEVTGIINTNGLVGLLNASAYGGSGPWNDLVNTYNSKFSGTATNITYITTVSNTALYFPNTSTSVVQLYSIPASFFTSTYTVSFWVFMNQTNKATDNAFLGNGQSGTNQGLHMGERGSYTYYGFFSDDLSGTINLFPSRWYNIVYQYNASNLTKNIYLNGVLDATGTATGAYLPTFNNTEVGRYSWNTTYNMFGYISQVAFYSRFLSPAEILDNYQALAKSYGLAVTTIPPVLRETTSSVRVSQIFDEVTPMIVTTGTVLNLDAKQYGGAGTVWADLSPTNDLVSLYNTTFSSSTSSYFTFNGSNSVVGTNYYYSGTGPQNFSLCAWFQTSVANGKIIGFESVNGLGSSGSYDRHIYVGTDGRLYFGVYPGFIAIDDTTSTSYANNIWHYVVATFTTATYTNNMLLYVDGSLTGVASSTGPPQAYSGWWKIGGNSIGGWNTVTNATFQGNISMVQVYNRPITAAEVSENFNQTRGRFGV